MAEARPPVSVLRAFGADGEPARLQGGQGGSWRAGSIVLKRAPGESEAEWTAGVLERVAGPGFRVARPIRAGGGVASVGGWCAYEYVAAIAVGSNGGRWPETLAACRAFHRSLEGIGRPEFLDVRDDPWAAADRLAFGEAHSAPLPMFADLIRRLQRISSLPDAPSQVIHGDFTANVLFAPGEEPCVIDFSPYWRPAAFALAVVVSDAITWANADPSIIDLCGDVPGFDQWLARATLRRVWEGDQHARVRNLDARRYLAAYERLVALLEERPR